MNGGFGVMMGRIHEFATDRIGTVALRNPGVNRAPGQTRSRPGYRGGSVEARINVQNTLYFVFGA